MTYLTDFFYDGRKIFLAFALTLISLMLFFFEIELIPYKIFLFLFSKYFGEISPIGFLIVYYFIVSYAVSSLIVGFYDIARRKGRKNNA